MKTILLVDDEEGIVDLLTTAIDEDLQNVATEVAADGLQASRMLLARQYDAVILDVNLPGKSGLAILREFVARESAIASKTVVISGEISSNAAQELLDLGVSAVFVKPFDLNQFTTRLQKILGQISE